MLPGWLGSTSTMRTSASGVDGFIEFGLKPWDMAAATVVIREAGGFVGDAAGGDRFLHTGNAMAANPKLFRELLRAIRASAQRTGDSALAEGWFALQGEAAAPKPGDSALAEG